MTSVSTAASSTSRSADAPVQVAVQHRADRLEIHLRGEVDIAAHDLLADQLSAVDLSGVAAVDLRLAELDFCDSFGARQLLDFADAARRSGCTVGLLDARPQLARLIALIDASTAA
jgi:anti-anti-sigma factor